MAMTSERAGEHIRDGADCISECIKAIERVQKSFPDLAPRIAVTTQKLREARTELQVLGGDIAQTPTSSAAA